ncbi:T9SS type A sorting domain-containing protein [Crocinitomicaceae bacterium]|nr:T9SS type A sorting domain-containing protein [Crocinitomicaceae bacterium]MDC1283037.1 T9SS type A sorting domain-containing protein [Crocinitomicaceae bacterium]|tara:strand:- start:27253 stop:28050 length:798 start_codon:yes stop_codon:yes gene_type:complete
MIKTISILALGVISINVSAQTQVYGEDFQNGLPVNYTIFDNDGFTPDASVIEFADAWISLTDPVDSTDSIVGSTSFFDPVGQADRWLITPSIVLGSYGNSIFWDAKSHDPSFPDDYMVLASKTDAQIASFTDTLLNISDESAEWNYHELNLSEAGLDGETVHIAFVNRTNDGFKLYLDSISVWKEDPVGLSSLVTFEVNVYPNPTNGKVNIGGDFDFVTVYSSTGAFVFESISNLIDLSSFDSGIYLFRVQSGDSVYRTRVVKEN